MKRLDPNDPVLAASDYPHGTRSGYDRGCSCDACRAAAARRTARNRARRTGGPRGRESGPRAPLGATTFAHLQRLLSYAPARSVAAAAGVSPTNMTILASGSPTTVTFRITAELINATTPGDVIAAAGKINVEVVQQKIEKIIEGGGTLTGLADHVGVQPNTLTRIVKGAYRTVRGDLARAILAATPDTSRSVYAVVDPTPSVRRREALRANGWTVAAIAEEAGLSVDTVDRIGHSPGLRWETAETLRRTYEQIGDTPGVSDISRRRARAQGAHPPICYDEEMNLIESSIRTVTNVREGEAQRRARLDLCSIRLYIDGMGPEAIRLRLQCSTRFPNDIRKALGVPAGGSPQWAATVKALRPLIEAVTVDLDYTSHLDHLDSDGVDYTARRETLVEDAAALLKAQRRAA